MAKTHLACTRRNFGRQLAEMIFSGEQAFIARLSAMTQDLRCADNRGQFGTAARNENSLRVPVFTCDISIAFREPTYLSRTGVGAFWVGWRSKLAGIRKYVTAKRYIFKGGECHRISFGARCYGSKFRGNIGETQLHRLTNSHVDRELCAA